MPNLFLAGKIYSYHLLEGWRQGFSILRCSRFCSLQRSFTQRFSRKIAMLIGEENLEKMCNKAQEVALQYRWDRNADQVQELYQLLAR